MKKLSTYKKWVSLLDAATHLSVVFGAQVSQEDVFNLLLEGRLMGSALTEKIIVWPWVRFSDKDPEQFDGEKRRLPDGSTIVLQREGTLLQGLCIVDFPVCTETRHFFRNIQLTSDYANKLLPFPAGTLVRVPETDKYFTVIFDASVPACTCEIVIRTDELTRFQASIDEDVQQSAPLLPIADGSVGGTRWPAHETENLRALRLATVKFWANFDQKDPSSAVTNKVVSEWLQKQGVSPTLADSMATILRPDGLKKGPRPNS